MSHFWSQPRWEYEILTLEVYLPALAVDVLTPMTSTSCLANLRARREDIMEYVAELLTQTT
jgi:hypothetical protein